MRSAWLAPTLLLALCLSLASGSLQAAPEKQKVTIAVGGKAALYYLPLTLAERLGYFKDEGLDVQILDFAGGSKALQAMMGGSADVVAGGFDHVIILRARGQKLKAFVLMVATPFAGAGHFERARRHLQVAARSQRHEDRRDGAWLQHQHLRQSPPGQRRLEPRRRVHHRRRDGPDRGGRHARRSDRRHRQRRTRHHHAGALGHDQGGHRDDERAGIAGRLRRICCRRDRCTRRRSSSSAIPRPRKP